MKKEAIGKNALTETMTATIEKLSHDGRGITHINGKTVFVEGALPNEVVQIAYTRKHPRYNEAKIIELITPSLERVKAKCEYFGICGGCSLQHMQADSQILHKQNMLLEQLQHFGKLQPLEVLPPLMGPIWQYRRKARLGVHFVAKKQSVLVGFREKNSRYLTDMHRCEILHPAIGELIDPLRELISSLEGYQHIPQIEIAVGDNANALIFRHVQTLSHADQNKLRHFSTQYHLHLYLQPGNAETLHLFWPENVAPELIYHLPNHQLEFLFHPTDFIQVNDTINQSLCDLAITLLAPEANDIVLDLFCGLGNFTLPIARHCQEVIGIESNPAMVKRAENNATHNKINNAKFFSADLETNFSKASWLANPLTKIFIDPPRTGALNAVQQLQKHPVSRFVYVSCNPATLARDAGILVHQQNYKLTKTGVIDMFPHTTHVESIALFER